MAAAQSFSVSVTPQSDSVTVTGGQSSTVNVDVTLQGQEFFCLQPQDLPVTVTSGGAQGITAAPSPEQVVFTVDAGVYGSDNPTGQGGPYNSTQSASVAIQAPSGTTSAFSAQVSVTAAFPGGDYSANQSDPTSSGGCGPSAFNSAEASGTIDVNVQPDAAPGDGNGDGADGGGGSDGGADGNTTDGGGDGGDDGENGSPMPAWIVPAGLIGAALIATRRRST